MRITSRVAPTSCVRTMCAPFKIATAVAAKDPARRSSGSGRSRSLPMKDFRESAMRIGRPSARSSPSPRTTSQSHASQGSAAFRKKPMPGSRTMRLADKPASCARVRLCCRRLRTRLIGLLRPRPGFRGHQDRARRPLGRHRGHAGIVAKSAHVVDHRGPRVQGGQRDPAALGVNGDRQGGRRAERADGPGEPADLFRLRDLGLQIRGGGHGADIDHVRALGGHLLCALADARPRFQRRSP